MNGSLILLAVPVSLVLLIGGAMSVEGEQQAAYSVNTSALPPLARDLLGDVESVRSRSCPELPLVWLLAEVQDESGWDPLAYSPAGAAGLLQMLPSSWADAGGKGAWDGGRPPADHPVWRPLEHLAVAIPWMCGHLHEMSRHINETAKPISVPDALAVCHLAGCSRVTGATTGLPAPGEAGCDHSCATQITDYIAAIHRWVETYLKPVPAVPVTGGAAAPYAGGVSGCLLPDPTGTGGCVTGTTIWMLTQAEAAFPGLPVSCWDAHAWNPGSDHPRGRACDFTIGRLGSFPEAEDVARGWAIAERLRANAEPLQLSYLIWQGGIWSSVRANEGWRAYTGGGVYDPTDPTGGHYDHIHVSVSR